MKLGIINDEVSQNIEDVIRFAKNYSLNGVEIRSINNLDIDKLSFWDIMKIKKMLDDAGLEVCNISSSFFKCSIDVKNEYDDNIRKLRKLIKISHYLGCNSIRGFSFFKDEINNFEKKFDEIVEKFWEPLKIIESEGITLLLESDPSVFTTNHKKLAKLISTLNSKNVKAIYDPGNDLYDPDGEIPYPDGFNFIKNFIKHVHIKDVKKVNGKPECVKFGTGDIQYSQIFRALNVYGYNGYIVLETHYRLGIKISQNLLKKPGGNEF